MNDRGNATGVSLIAGMLLGLAGALEGFSGFVIVLLLGIVGLTVGRVLDGQLDLSEYIGRTRRDIER